MTRDRYELLKSRLVMAVEQYVEAKANWSSADPQTTRDRQEAYVRVKVALRALRAAYLALDSRSRAIVDRSMAEAAETAVAGSRP